MRGNVLDSPFQDFSQPFGPPEVVASEELNQWIARLCLLQQRRKVICDMCSGVQKIGYGKYLFSATRNASIYCLGNVRLIAFHKSDFDNGKHVTLTHYIGDTKHI